MLSTLFSPLANAHVPCVSGMVCLAYSAVQMLSGLTSKPDFVLGALCNTDCVMDLQG